MNRCVWLEPQHFDLYLLDNWLSGFSGIELCKELRSFDSKTPILFYSGAAYPLDKKQTQECGAQGYLTKPTDGDQLAREVLRLIAASQSRQFGLRVGPLKKPERADG